MLHSVYLFKDVKITPDYSVVHDLTPDQWKTYLIGDADNPGHGDIVFQQSLNYYRLPDVIRIEANYDEIRKVTYGMIDGTRNTDPTQLVIKESYERPMFFFVKDVRLIRQDSRTDKEEQTRPWVWDVKDVVELDIEVDVWSSNGGSFNLYDSYVERKHMPRWKNTGTDLSPVWEPIYYPNAGQGIEGAYQKESKQDVTGTMTFPNLGELNICFILMSVIDNNGTAHIYGGIEAYRVSSGNRVQAYHQDGATFKPFIGYTSILDGSAMTATHTTADYVQCIAIIPWMQNAENYFSEVNDGGIYKLVYDEPAVTDATSLSYIDFSGFYLRLMSQYSQNMSVIKPDHSHQIVNPDYDPSDPDSPQYLDDYDEEHEPMMYYSPARVRKCTTSLGGEIFTVPDIIAFEEKMTVKNMYDLNNITLFVFTGKDVDEANFIGSMGVVETPTLPIYNSAWKSYEAINKVGDEIAFNAKQMQTFANGAAGTASSAIMGGFVGNIPGAILGAATGIISTTTGLYGNSEELRAKQVTIKNSPCNVKSGGSGLGAAMSKLTDIQYVTLKMDDQSMEKLRFMYYWFGYHVNRTIKGTVDLHTRSKFDYIKTSGAKVRGDLTAGAVRQISSIFDAGVTIYHGTAGYELIGTGDMKENDEI